MFALFYWGYCYYFRRCFLTGTHHRGLLSLTKAKEKEPFSVGTFVAKGYFGGGTPDHFDWSIIITNPLSSFVIVATCILVPRGHAPFGQPQESRDSWGWPKGAWPLGTRKPVQGIKTCTRYRYFTCTLNWLAYSRATFASLSEEYFSFSNFTVGEVTNSLVFLKSNSACKHRKQIHLFLLQEQLLIYWPKCPTSVSGTRGTCDWEPRNANHRHRCACFGTRFSRLTLAREV